MDAFAALVDRKPPTATVVLAANPDEAPRLSKARADVDRAKSREGAATTDDARARAAAAVEDARDALAAARAEVATITFHVAGIGQHLVEELIAAYPMSKQQTAKYRKDNNGQPPGRMNWDEERFAPALISACVERIEHSSPDVEDTAALDVGQATALWKSKGLTLSDKSILFLTCLGLDQRDTGAGDLGEG